MKFLCVGAAVLVLMWSPGCSGGSGDSEDFQSGHDDHGYDIPKDVCGTPVDSDTLQGILAPGDEIEARTHEYDGYFECRFLVDSTRIMAVDVGFSDFPFNVDDHTSFHEKNGGNIQWGEVNEGDAFFSASGSATTFPCGENSEGGHAIVMMKSAHDFPGDPGDPERAERVEEFFRDFAPEFAKDHGCLS